MQDGRLLIVMNHSDLIYVQIGRVASQDGRRFADGIQLLKHHLLHVHALEHRLDDKIHVREGAVRQRWLQQRLHLFALRLGDTLPAHLIVDQLSYGGDSSLKELCAIQDNLK